MRQSVHRVSVTRNGSEQGSVDGFVADVVGATVDGLHVDANIANGVGSWNDAICLFQTSKY